MPLIMIDVGGTVLNYLEKGEGPTVIFVHGVAGDYRIWKEIADPLSKHFRTIAYSRRCSNPNQNRDVQNSTVENNVKDLEGLVEKSGGGPVVLVGHAYGGAISALYTAKRPERVSSIVLMEPFMPSLLSRNPRSMHNLSMMLTKPSVARSASRWMKSMEAIGSDLDAKEGGKAVEKYLDDICTQEEEKRSYPKKAKEMMVLNAQTIREADTARPPFTKKDAKTIAQPTLLIQGEHSPKASLAMVGILHKAMPNNQVATVKGSAHLLPVEKPGECLALIDNFLKERKGKGQLT
ncbi:MAG: haloalkane dehalogenase [Methanomassiliicoccales archaeon PtaU1.Bin124]|nr:MAG: haloalkane dehalogenase [Methanomassiliicoccales archaeon PtaU1.Bin124]